MIGNSRPASQICLLHALLAQIRVYHLGCCDWHLTPLELLSEAQHE